MNISDTIRIREAKAADAPAMNALTTQLGYKATIAETEQRLRLLLDLSADNCLLVAELHGQVIGWIHGFVAVRLKSGVFAEIGGLVVAEHHRGEGAGRQLVQQVRQWCQQKGIQQLRVRCNSKRLETHRFYTNLGFEQIKEQKIFELQV